MSDTGSDGGIRSDWATKDFYKELGVAKTASADEIKKAYRKLARANHPDSHPDDTAKHERFKSVAEAYDVIGDPDKRKKYDQARELFASGGGFPAGGFGGGVNLDDLLRDRAGGAGGGFGDLFGDFLGFGAGARRQQPRPARGADLETTATIGFVDALEGVTVSLRISADGACQTCHGTGGKPGTRPHACPVCEGAGFVTASVGGAFSMNETCPGCGGRQLVYDDPCPTCRGTGLGQSTRTIQAKVPAGVKNGQRIRLRGKGAPGDRGGPAGDLFVTVKVTPDRVFGRKGDNLTIDVPIAFTEAALGAQVKVPTLGGPPVTLKIPPGTPNGRTFRVRGKGAPKKDGTHGDLLATVEVQVPATLTDDAREALETYAAATADARLRAGLFEPVEGVIDMASRQPFGTNPPPPEAAVFVISVAAELSGLHPQTLRTYERMGLITPGRTPGGGRRYSYRDIEHLRVIAELTGSGIGIEGVRRILELESAVATLRAQRDELLAELDAAHEALRQALAARPPAGSKLPAVRPPTTPQAIVVWRRHS